MLPSRKKADLPRSPKTEDSKHLSPGDLPGKLSIRNDARRINFWKEAIGTRNIEEYRGISRNTVRSTKIVTISQIHHDELGFDPPTAPSGTSPSPISDP
jgi:hypothetical protein